MVVETITTHRRLGLCAVVALVFLWVAAGSLGGGQPTVRGGVAERAPSGYLRLPLSFEPNVGQSDRRALFVAHGERTTLLLTPREAVLALGDKSSGGHTLALQFPGAREPVLAGTERLPGRLNYFAGRDRSRWRTGVPTYARVHYVHLWPGIDATFYGSASRLEYDLELQRGADPRRIALRFSGARHMRIASGGDLELTLAGGMEVREFAPVAYQLADGQRRAVASHFVLSGGLVRVALGRYDHHLPLIVDPALAYSTYLGGSGSTAEIGNAIAVDKNGQAYLAGSTASTDFPQAGPRRNSGGERDAFVAKLNAAGNGLIYSTYLGGRGSDRAFGIAVDAQGNAYVAGRTKGPTLEQDNFPTTEGAFQESCADNVPEHPGACPEGDAFVAKLDPTGAIVYSTYFGGNGEEFAGGIAIDSAGEAFITGPTTSTDEGFASPGAYQTECRDSKELFPKCEIGDGFIAKLNAAGSERVYATYLGGNHGDVATAIALDAAGDAYVTGFTQSTDLKPSEGAFQSEKRGGLLGQDAFVSELNPAGSELVYLTYLGGDRDDAGFAIAVDAERNAYVTGLTYSANFWVKHAEQSSCGDPGCSQSDGFVTRLDAGGRQLGFSTYLGGGAQDAGRGIALDGTGGVYVTGSTTSRDFPTLAGVQPASGGREDAFVTKLGTASGTPVYSSYLGGSGVESGRAIAVDAAGSAYLTGYTSSAADFPLKNPLQPAYGGGLSDVLVAKLAPPDTTAPTSSAARPLCRGPATLTVTDDREGSGARGVRFRLDGALEQRILAAGNPGAAAIAIPEGTHSLEYWGEDAAGNQELAHHTLAVQTDTTPPTLSITSDQRFASYEIGDNASVTIAAADAGSGLLSDPSRRNVRLATRSSGSFVAAISATDHCANSTQATFAYRVIRNPSFAHSVNLEPRGGTITVKLPASAHASRARTASAFLALSGARQVPVGTVVEATGGAVAVTAARSRAGGLQVGTFRGGRFKVLQGSRGNGLVELRLIDASPSRACKSARELGSLRASASGRFRTVGRYSAATTRGPAAAWAIKDLCRATVINVVRGSVAVRDLRSRKRKVIRAGGQHLARAR
jgi:hypothetical protein